MLRATCVRCLCLCYAHACPMTGRCQRCFPPRRPDLLRPRVAAIALCPAPRLTLCLPRARCPPLQELTRLEDYFNQLMIEREAQLAIERKKARAPTCALRPWPPPRLARSMSAPLSPESLLWLAAWYRRRSWRGYRRSRRRSTRRPRCCRRCGAAATRGGTSSARSRAGRRARAAKARRRSSQACVVCIFARFVYARERKMALIEAEWLVACAPPPRRGAQCRRLPLTPPHRKASMSSSCDPSGCSKTSFKRYRSDPYTNDPMHDHQGYPVPPAGRRSRLASITG